MIKFITLAFVLLSLSACGWEYAAANFAIPLVGDAVSSASSPAPSKLICNPANGIQVVDPTVECHAE